MTHAYLSTSCLHAADEDRADGERAALHARCSSVTGVSDSGERWAKAPACCKHCGAPCRCPCHGGPAADVPDRSGQAVTSAQVAIYQVLERRAMVGAGAGSEVLRELAREAAVEALAAAGPLIVAAERKRHGAAVEESGVIEKALADARSKGARAERKRFIAAARMSAVRLRRPVEGSCVIAVPLAAITDLIGDGDD